MSGLAPAESTACAVDSAAALHGRRCALCGYEPMNVIETDLPGCVIVEPKVFGDARGAFWETWNRPRYAAAGLDFEVTQANVSVSERGVLRGLHYQWPNPQGKLVHVVEGEVYD